MDQNNNIGVSVEIMVLPRETAGIKAHNIAANLPVLSALGVSSYSLYADRHKIRVIINWIIGVKKRTPKLLCPKSAWEISIIQAINGGLE